MAENLLKKDLTMFAFGCTMSPEVRNCPTSEMKIVTCNRKGKWKMAITFDAVSALEEEVQRSTKRTPFLFSVKENEKGLIHALVNLNEAIVLPLHEAWDELTGTYAASNICATAPHLDLPATDCVHCVAAEKNPKLKAKPRVFLPVFVHAIQQRVGDRWITVTYRGDDGADRASGGLRVVELKTQLARKFSAYYKESTVKIEDRSIQLCDYVIERMSKTEYDVRPNPGASLEIPSEFVKEWAQTTRESLIEKITDLRPIQIVGELNANVAALPRSNPVNPTSIVF